MKEIFFVRGPGFLCLRGMADWKSVMPLVKKRVYGDIIVSLEYGYAKKKYTCFDYCDGLLDCRFVSIIMPKKSKICILASSDASYPPKP